MVEQTVFVVDDDEAIRDSIAELLTSVGLPFRLFSSAQEFLDVYDGESGGCLVLDVRMARMSGLKLQERMRDEKISLPIIFISGHGDIPMAVRTLKLGAVDFLPKPYREDALLESINHALAMDREQRKSGETSLQTAMSTLTPRERDVLDLLLKGNPGKEVARELDISPRTVEVHRQRVIRKFNVRSLHELLALFNGS